MFENVFDWAFRDGCGMTLDEALSSPRFSEILTEYQGANLADDSPEAAAFKAGHLIMGKLLNKFPEKEAIDMARDQGDDFMIDLKERALIQFLGESLVSAAEKCLPDEALKLAKEWQNPSADDQIEIAKKLWWTFRSDSQDPIKNDNVFNLMDKIIQGKQDVSKEKAILPLLYGKWDKEKCFANCQGKSQMLTTFARLAGARSLVVSPLVHSREKMNEVLMEGTRMVMSDLSERGLENSDELLRKSIDGTIMRCFTEFSMRGEFHVGVALELEDGRWVLIDPHGLVWGVLPEFWNIGSVWEILNKYKIALPGLSLTRDDDGVTDSYFESKLKLVAEIINRSRNCEEKIKTDNIRYDVIIDYFKNSPEFDFIVLEFQKEENVDIEDVKKSLNIPEFREFMIMLMMSPSDDPLDFRVFDPDYLKEKVDSWLSSYHTIAMNKLIERPYERGELVHPVCEFSRPEYGLAMGVLNSLSQYSGVHGYEANEFFLRNSFDQMSLFNALSRRYSREDLRKVASETLLSLPFIHSSCRARLGIF